jgi:uncharacterized protein with GYD domain
MPHWIRLVTMTEAGVEYLRTDPHKFLAQMNKLITDNGGNLVAAFATLGPFDLVSIIQAPSENVMRVIEEAVEDQGYYTAENYHAIPAKEYLATVARSPIFLSSWLQGRELAQAQAEAKSGRPRKPRAASKLRKRPMGIETRTVQRSQKELGDKASIVFERVKPVIKAPVVNISLTDQGESGGLAFRVTFEEAKRIEVIEWEPNMPLRLSLDIKGERESLELPCRLVRVDLVDMEQYEVAVCYEGLSQAMQRRVEKLVGDGRP